MDGEGASAACAIGAGSPDGDASCLVNKALAQGKPIVCQACHYSPALDLAQLGPLGGDPGRDDPLANDNVTATQLQGHSGTLIECSACHGAADLGNTLKGPHGMHPVGNTRFSDGGHEDLAERNLKACATCHGARGQGTVLSRAAVSRTLSTEEGSVRVAKGQPVACDLCHENPFTHD